MRRKFHYLFAVLSLAALTGCVAPLPGVNFDNVRSLQAGLTAQREVLEIFGPPDSETIGSYFYTVVMQSPDGTEPRALRVDFGPDRKVKGFLWRMAKIRVEGSRRVQGKPLDLPALQNAWQGKRILLAAVTSRLGEPNKAAPGRLLYLYQVFSDSKKTQEQELFLQFDAGGQLTGWWFLDPLAPPLPAQIIDRAKLARPAAQGEWVNLLGPPACVVRGLRWFWRAQQGNFLEARFDDAGKLAGVEVVEIAGLQGFLDPEMLRFAEIEPLFSEK